LYKLEGTECKERSVEKKGEPSNVFQKKNCRKNQKKSDNNREGHYLDKRFMKRLKTGMFFNLRPIMRDRKTGKEDRRGGTPQRESGLETSLFLNGKKGV